MAVTSIRITYFAGRSRPKPAAGDRRITKKHGLQIRVPEMHDGCHVYRSGRPSYVWQSPGQLKPTQQAMYLTAEERDQLKKGGA